MRNLQDLNKKEIIKRFAEESFASATFEQVKNDFLKVGIEIQFKDEHYVTKEAFTQQLGGEIDAIMREAPHILTQLFYLVDLPENQVDIMLSEANNPALELADALLIRAGQKVYFKQKYKLKH
ncbi:MAG: hypothetical protein COA32_00155 [Fluviicola sp.]|nr:MAG: hypothetical protein COA32_00155 [Fluviicola sp.]